MKSITEVKDVAQKTQKNVENLADQAKENLMEAKENAPKDLNQIAEETKSVLVQGVDGAQTQIGAAISDSKEAIGKTKDAAQKIVENPSSLIDEDVKIEAAEVRGNIEATANKVKSQVQTSLEQAQESPRDTLMRVTRQMADAGNSPQASAEALLRRLNWGEPALTIVDVRHRDSFNQERIRGAISMPEADLVSNALKSLECDRELFVYGETSLQAAQSVASLRQAGFMKVAFIGGGIPAWQTVGGATEGIAA